MSFGEDHEMDKEYIREHVDIVDVVSEYVPLKQRYSSPIFWGCCPFHGERTPSFEVDEDKGLWHCFGCDKGGDVFAFVMEVEGIGFREAMELLREKIDA